jgi:CRISPR-associated protein Cmr3
MNTLLLTPSDTLFFRDGRPMSGSLGGHGAAWPLPTVTDAALHAALWRAGDTFKGAHAHRRGRNGKYSNIAEDRDRQFGSLVTAGPFPVLDDDTWLFPRPLDAGWTADGSATLLPLARGFDCSHSSLPSPLRFAVANTQGPTKYQPSPWWNRSAWQAYLGSARIEGQPAFFRDDRFSDREFSYGIGMDPVRGTQDGERFYSAHSLRLKPGCRIGLLAKAEDKDFKGPSGSNDLIESLFPNSGAASPIMVGGQQRVSSVTREHHANLPLPVGSRSGFEQEDKDGKTVHLVKWVLLTPAIFPAIKDHSGGWLPSWVNPAGEVQLLDGPGKNYVARHGGTIGKPISAQLVAALVGKAIPVIGYALASEKSDRPIGSKPTLLAVPPGSVYYFACNSQDAAAKLAAALNWHGSTDGGRIANRRSALFGEKGFGLGVCSTWRFHDGNTPS